MFANEQIPKFKDTKSQWQTIGKMLEQIISDSDQQFMIYNYMKAIQKPQAFTYISFNVHMYKLYMNECIYQVHKCVLSKLKDTKSNEQSTEKMLE